MEPWNELENETKLMAWKLLEIMRSYVSGGIYKEIVLAQKGIDCDLQAVVSS